MDHIGAAGLFPKNVTIIAQDETARELQSAKAVAKKCYDGATKTDYNFFQELYNRDWKSNR